MIIRGKLLSPRIPNWRARAAAALAVLIVTAEIVHADVRVGGDTSSVQLDATASTVAEALSALESTFGLRVNAPKRLDRAVSGTYKGALPKVLSRLLQGYNYVIRQQATTIEVTIIGSQGDSNAAVLPPPRRPPANPALSLSEAVRLKVH